jgi:TP901 family phage tail tape measure protein
MPIQETASIIVSAQDRATGALDNIGQSLGNIKMLAAGAGAAIGGLITYQNIQAAKEFETAMLELQKVTSEGFAEKFRKDVFDMADQMALTQEQLAGLSADAARFGIRGSENIRKFVESVGRMSIATQISAENAGEQFAKLETIMGVPVKQTENLGSAINALSNNFATSADEIVNATLRSSASLTQLGLGENQILGLVTALNEVTPNARFAGTALRRLGDSLQRPKRIEEIAKGFGITANRLRKIRRETPLKIIMKLAEVMKKGGERANYFSEVLNARTMRAVRGLGQNLSEARDAVNFANEEFKEGTSLQEEHADAADTTANRFQRLQNSVKELQISLGLTLLPAVNDSIGAFNWLVDSINSLPAPLDKVISYSIAGVGALSGLYLIGKGLAAVFGGLSSAAGTAATALGVGGLSTSATTAGAAVAGVVAELAWIWGLKKFDDTKFDPLITGLAAMQPVVSPLITIVAQLEDLKDMEMPDPDNPFSGWSLPDWPDIGGWFDKNVVQPVSNVSLDNPFNDIELPDLNFDGVLKWLNTNVVKPVTSISLPNPFDAINLPDLGVWKWIKKEILGPFSGLENKLDKLVPEAAEKILGIDLGGGNSTLAPTVQKTKISEMVPDFKTNKTDRRITISGDMIVRADNPDEFRRKMQRRGMRRR